jgi:rod shape-determining protein MreC
MQQFFYFFIRFKIFWVFLIFETFSLVLVFNDSPFHKASFTNTANAFTGSVYSAANDITEYFHLRKINHDLMQENAKLHSSFYSKDSAVHKTDTVHFKDSTDKYVGRYLYIAADVISNSTAKRNNYLMLNVGTANGVTKQCGVVCSDGVVGIVYDVSEHFCTVISLLHSGAHISSKIDSANNAGTLMWDGKSPLYAQMDDINKHVKVEPGQGISTSGLSYIFPRNIKVGTVYESKVVGNTNSITVKLSTPFETLYKVYVVRNLDFEEQQRLLNSIKEK